jgi:dTDP-4-dehydrorhamnose 3,5-epimerase
MKRFFNDVILFTPTVYQDNRGVFFQSFDKEIQDVIGEEFVQDNHSYSHKNVIRGLHYQWDKPMGKLLRVVRGSAIDYFVDIREGSPTYGQYDCVELNEDNYKMIWIPEGFAHGFISLSDHTTVLYKCTAYYNSAGESGINVFDPDINIQWPVDKEEIIISDRDLQSLSFKEYTKDIKFKLRRNK